MIRCARPRGRPCLFVLTRLAGLLAGLMVLSQPTAVAAQSNSWFGNGSAYPRRMAVHRHSLSKRARERDDAGATQNKKGSSAEAKPSRPLFAVLSLSDQRISVYNRTGLVTRSRPSSGKPGHRTR